MHPAIFLDRDGVLIENKPDYVRDWSEVHIFPQALGALAFSHAKNYKIVVVTNQSGVGRSLISLETAQGINQKLVQVILEGGAKIDGVYMCPHRPEEHCNCRKPRPGLLLQAARELEIDLQRSWMVGDAWSDLLAGKAAGVPGGVILRTGRGKEQLRQRSPEGVGDYLIFNDLSDALTGIFRIDDEQHKTASSSIA